MKKKIKTVKKTATKLMTISVDPKLHKRFKLKCTANNLKINAVTDQLIKQWMSNAN